MPRARPFLIVFTVLVGGVVACSVNDEKSTSEGKCLFGPTCGAPDAGVPNSSATQVDAAAASEQPDAAVFGGDLCGAVACSPDDALSCALFEPTDAGLAPPSASLDELSTADPRDASPGDGGDAGPREGGAPLADAAATDAGADQSVQQSFACQVPAASGIPRAHCALAGAGKAGARCIAAADCAAGLGCVGETGEGRCQPYCCAGTRVCEAGSYCSPRPLLEDSNSSVSGASEASTHSGQRVPVCVPSEDCALDDPFPCTGANCRCPTDTACSVVRDDGMTGCVAPGRGRSGESCPCHAGYFCSSATGTCLQICGTDEGAPMACTAGRCQTASGFPAGFGLCVGIASENPQ